MTVIGGKCDGCWAANRGEGCDWAMCGCGCHDAGDRIDLDDEGVTVRRLGYGMTDLIAFLKARLDEDEAAARSATPGPWCWEATGDKDSSWAAGLVQDEDGNPLTGEIGHGQGVVIDGVCESIDGNPADGEHIVRHDPARVLRDVEADRKLLDSYERATRYRDRVFAQPEPRGISDEMRAVTQMMALEQVMKLRVAIWSGHPDYRQEWNL